MTHKKEVVFSLLFVIMVLCTGCSDKDNGDTSKNNRTSGESFVQEETIESTDNTDNADGSSAPTPELKTPRTKKELEDALGTVNESGKWTPPAGLTTPNRTTQFKVIEFYHCPIGIHSLSMNKLN